MLFCTWLISRQNSSRECFFKFRAAVPGSGHRSESRNFCCGPGYFQRNGTGFHGHPYNSSHRLLYSGRSRIDVLFEDAMSALMDRREHGRNRIVFIVMVRDADIVSGKTGCKRMLTYGSGTGINEKSRCSSNSRSCTFIWSSGYHRIRPKAVLSGCGAARILRQQREQVLLSALQKSRSMVAESIPFLELIEQYIVGILAGIGVGAFLS